MRFNHVCVLGMGYIGLPTAATLASRGLRITGVDVNRGVLETLKKGGLHIVEPGLAHLMQAATQAGRIEYSAEVVTADAFIIAVPTPFKENKLADMTYVVSAAESIIPVLRKGNLVVLESTSPPRTTVDLVMPILERSGLKAGEDFYLAYSPERVLPGQILKELIENDRVIGGVNSESAAAGRELYSSFVEGEIILSDATTAEMVKLMENTYRDINIAIANEFARLSDRFGTNVWEAISLANRHPRVKILNPGPGVGGHCISVDPWFFVEAAPDITSLILSARRVNDSQPHFVVEWMEKKTGSLADRQVCLLGLTYKPDVDDFRESPAVEVAHLLAAKGAKVSAYDPFSSKEVLPGINVSADLAAAVQGAEIVVVMVAHRQVLQLVTADFASAPAIFDCVNGFKGEAWGQYPGRLFKLGSNEQG